MASIITLGMLKGPITTRREAGEGLLDSVKRHRAALMASVPTGDKLMTTWQTPGGQEVVTTTRMLGEPDAAVGERHLSAFSQRWLLWEIRRTEP